VATQNPSNKRHVSAAEAQLDRFFFEINIGYPSTADEEQIVLNTSKQGACAPEIIEPRDLSWDAALIPRRAGAGVRGQLLRGAGDATRPTNGKGRRSRASMGVGGGPRASQTLLRRPSARAAAGVPRRLRAT